MFIFPYIAPPIVSAEAQLTEVLLGEDFKVVFTISNDIPLVLPSDITWTFTSSLSGLETVLDDSTDRRFDFSSDMLTLTVTSALLLDDGVYTVRARNPAGPSSDYTRITVYGETGRNRVCVREGGGGEYKSDQDDSICKEGIEREK